MVNKSIDKNYLFSLKFCVWLEVFPPTRPAVFQVCAYFSLSDLPQHLIGLPMIFAKLKLCRLTQWPLLTRLCSLSSSLFSLSPSLPEGLYLGF